MTDHQHTSMTSHPIAMDYLSGKRVIRTEEDWLNLREDMDDLAREIDRGILRMKEHAEKVRDARMDINRTVGRFQL